MHTISIPPRPSFSGHFSPHEIYSDSRAHGPQGPTRNVRIPRTASSGGAAIAKSEDGARCVVAGVDSLRILRVLQPSQSSSESAYKTAVGRGGFRIESSRNLWEGSGLKIDSANTDVAWGHATFGNKILTSARNGEFIMWDVNRASGSKYERKSKVHMRSINKISISLVLPHYCITGSSDADIRVWDLRDMTKPVIKIYHPISVRSVVFSPSVWQPLQAVAGLDNGSIYRWDLRHSQKGLLDRLPLAHSGPVMALDWCSIPARPTHSFTGTPDSTSIGNSLGWLASGGLDRSVKIWNLTAPSSNAHISRKPTYSLHPSFPVRRVVWRPSYDCELAVVSNEAFGTGSNHDLGHTPTPGARTGAPQPGVLDGSGTTASASKESTGDTVEIWDIRRRWIAKWSVTGSAGEGGVTDLSFPDSHTVWAQHFSGTFSQIDLRDCTKPIDAVPRVALSWEASGSFVFVSDRKSRWEVPYDDTNFTTRQLVGDRTVKVKAFGDPAAMPASQNLGTISNIPSTSDLNSFTKLARSYVFEGDDRKAICRHNAEAASRAGRGEAACSWSMLATLLTDILPESPQPEPQSLTNDKHSPSPQPITPISAPATTYSFPPRTDLPRLTSPSSRSLTKSHIRTNSKTSSPSLTPDAANIKLPRRVTPNSSATSSPRYATGTLPTPTSHRHPSHLGRRESDSGLSSKRRQSVHRRPSISTISSSGAGDSLRHVGEGALDSSDSSEEGGESGERGDVSSGEDRDQPPASPQPTPNPNGLPTITLSPMPFSRRDIEDHDRRQREEAVSPSPKSSDTASSDDTGSPPLVRPHAKIQRRNPNRVKTRSRSSTGASGPPVRRTLVKQESQSSLRTVLAADVGHDMIAESSQHHHQHQRQTSQGIPPGILLSPDVPRQTKDGSVQLANALSERRPDIVRADEKRFRDVGWKVFREQLEVFADEGDAQMCAMLSLVASEELHLDRRRVARFLESYIELLTRLRLDGLAAHLRKYAGLDDLRMLTRLETTIYTLCAHCRKPFSPPVDTPRPGHHLKGGYSYCRTCRSYPAKCSICRLPVRTMLFQCPICHHGGHQECYVRYYMARPMVNLPSSSVLLPIENIPRSRHPSSTGSTEVAGSDDDNVTVADSLSVVDGDIQDHQHGTNRISGHPCAAGCGHICWAANGLPDYVPLRA